MQLRDRGKLSLDDKVTRWVPELREIHDPYGMIDSITIRMLLSHSSGFQNATWPYGNGEPWEPFEPTTWNQLVAMMPYQQLLFKPGSKYSYSNPGFIYLARIIEKMSGDPWDVVRAEEHLVAARAGSELLREHAVLSRRAIVHTTTTFGATRSPASGQRDRQRRRLRSGHHDPERRLECAAR